MSSSSVASMPLRETTLANLTAHNRTLDTKALYHATTTHQSHVSNNNKNNNKTATLKQIRQSSAQCHSATVLKDTVSNTPSTTPAAVPLKQVRPFSRPLLRPLAEVGRTIDLTVVLDLDETLVSNRRTDIAHAILRPYALHALNALRHKLNLEIVLWTASTRETATPVLYQLQERGTVFDEVIFRSSEWFTEPVHTKDLRLLGRDMSKVVVIDNAPNCCKLNPNNAVLIEDFHGRADDQGRHDGSLVNMYYIIEALLAASMAGRSVTETLYQLQREQELCRAVEYPLSAEWQGRNLREYNPLFVPPHGKYLRIVFESAAPLEHWTI